MRNFQAKPNKSRRVPVRLWVVGLSVLAIVIIAVVFVRHMYYQNLQPVSSSQQTQIVTISSGMPVKKIAAKLADAGVIRNAWVFEWYVHSKELGTKLQAGTYALSPGQDLQKL